VPTVDEVLHLVSQVSEHNLLIAVDLKAAGVAQEVVRIAQKHQVLHRLLFIGRTISEPQVREQIRSVSKQTHTAAVANHAEEFPTALAATNADWVYFRYLPPREQMDAVRAAGKRGFIAGVTVSGRVPQNWQQAADLGIDGVLTDYSLELAEMLRHID